MVITGQPYAEQSECFVVLLLTICIILGFKIMYDGHFYEYFQHHKLNGFETERKTL